MNDPTAIIVVEYPGDSFPLFYIQEGRTWFVRAANEQAPTALGPVLDDLVDARMRGARITVVPRERLQSSLPNVRIEPTLRRHRRRSLAGV